MIDELEKILKEPKTDLSVADFFDGKNVFITGASGFMGRVLLEKLLWSCSNIGNIYILMRPKKSVSASKRLEEMFHEPIFDRLKARDPSILSKIIPISGDITKVNLALNLEDRKLLEDSISVIFHAASSVRFTDPIKEAIIINVRGTREIMELAKNMKNLKVMTYVSTSYSNCVSKTIEETFVPSDYDWKTMIKLAESGDENLLRIIEPKIIDRRPNTYTFTKALAESVVHEYSKDIPCTIIRPSIIIPTLYEPITGWLINAHGIVGLLSAIDAGLIHVMYSKENSFANIYPCDFSVNGIILATWYRGISENNKCIVMNSAKKTNADMMAMLNESKENRHIFPLNTMIWYPWVIITGNMFLFNLCTILFHLMPAYFIDFIMKLKGVNFSLVRIYRKVLVQSLSLSYFTNEWEIKTDKYYSMQRFISKYDLETFRYDISEIPSREIVLAGMLGVKKFVLKEEMSEEAIEVARRGLLRRYWIHQITKILLFCLFIWILYLYGFIPNRLKQKLILR